MTIDADDPDRAPRRATSAKAAAGEAARRILKDGIQIHGGIGYTWEHDLHLYLRRATADEYLLGTTGWHLDRLADLLIDHDRPAVASRRGRGVSPVAERISSATTTVVSTRPHACRV